MSRKAFITRGLILIHAFFLIIFASAFWAFAKYPVIIENDPELFLRVSFIILIAAFLFLCWKQIKTTG